VAEVGLSSPSADDQTVVRNRVELAIGSPRGHRSSLEIEARHLRELDRDVPLASKDVAYRRGDLPLGQDPRRNLVEERLEQVVVDPVDKGHLDRAPSQEARREQPAEAAPHDHNSVRTSCAPGCRGVDRAFHDPRRSYVTVEPDRSPTGVAP
jgi:hypothetical protein